MKRGCRGRLVGQCLRAVWAWASLLVLWQAGALPSQAAPASVDEGGLWNVRVGFQDVYRTGSWTPLLVSSASSSGSSSASGGGSAGRLCAWAEDSDGQWVRSPAMAVTQAADGTQSVRFLVRFGRPVGRVLLEQMPPEDAGGDGLSAEISAEHVAGLAPISLPAPLPGGETVVLVVGELPSMERAARLMARDDGSRPRVVAVADPRLLGPTGLDYDGADAIIVCGRSVAALRGADAAALVGIDAWVRRGGRLVFLAGADAVRAGLAESVAAGWIPGLTNTPGRMEGMAPLRRATAIESYARADRPLDKKALQGLEVPLLADAAAMDGVIEAFEGTAPSDLPLVVRSPHGFGTITWIGLDLDQGFFRTWQGTDTLLVELLGGRPKGKSAGRGAEGARNALDMAGQLRLAVDQFPSVRPVPFEIIGGLALLYIAALYPLDWWLVSRGKGRFRLAWLSLPLLVAGFVALAGSTARQWKSEAGQESQADLVDIDMAGLLTRGVSFAGIWSPANATLDTAAVPREGLAVPPADIVVSWFGAVGRGLGATDSPTSHPSLASADYAYGPSLATLRGIPLAASSSRLLEAEWIAACPRPPLEASLTREAQGTLRGEVVNRLDFPLEDCRLVHSGWLYDIGRLEPGASYSTHGGKGPRSLAGALTRNAANAERIVATRWDPAELDPLRILEVAGLHAAAGGSAYTSSDPGRLGRFDLSPLLNVDRAVLVGRGPRGTAWRQTTAGPEAVAMPSGSALEAGSGLWRIVIPLKTRRP